MRKFLLSAMAVCYAFTVIADTITLDIPSADQFANWTVIDANGDGGDNMWHYDDEDAIYNQNKTKAADDWLISPGVQLEGDACYKVSAYVYNATTFSSDKQKFTINGGTAPSVGALSTQIYKNESLTRGSFYNNYDGTFNTTDAGTYYFAIHCYSDGYNGDFKFQKFVLEKVAVHPGAVTNLTVTPAEQGVMEATLTWTWPTASDQGGVFIGEMGANIYRSTSSSFPSDLSSCLIGSIPLGDQGATGSFVDNSIPSPGKYYYQVIPFNSDGASTSATQKIQSNWIGKDTSLGSLSNVVATVIDDHTVAINFDIPGGSNGGYVDPSEISYKITRKAGSDSEITLEEAYKGELPYYDRNVNGLNSYTYKVYHIYNGSTAWAGSSSNAVTLGGAIDLPYSQDFSTSNHFFSFFHGPDATRDWSVSSSRLQYWGNPADAYAVSPGINLKAGAAYKLSFSTRISSSSSGSEKPLRVIIGKAATAAGLNQELFTETISSTFDSTKEIDFSVEEDGVYYLGFHCQGTVNSNDIYVDNISLKEIPVAPLEAVDLTATPAEGGEMKVILKWTNPTENNAGGSLSKIDKAIIKRGGSELATVTTGLTPGEEYTYTDSNVTAPGIYKYSVTLYLGDNASSAVEATTTWVGTDTPQPLANASAVKDETSGAVTISWDAMEEVGQNGGYVDTQNVSYNVVRMPDNKVIASEISATSAIDPADDASLGMYFYTIIASQYPEMEAAVTDKVQLGDAIAVTEENSYRPDFSTEDDFELWTMTNGGEGTGLWKYNSSSQSLKTSFVSNHPWALTPPLKLLAGKYKVQYKATCYSARYTSNIEIYLTDAPSHEATLKNKLHEKEITSVSFPNTTDVEFEVDKDGVYYIGYVEATSDPWELNLTQADVVLVELAPRPEAPLAPANVTASIQSDGSRLISFSEVSEDINGLAIENVTYNIYRNDVLLTEQPISVTTYTDEEEGFVYAKFIYSVEALFEDFRSEIADADPVYFGNPFEMEYAHDFANDNEIWHVNGTSTQLAGWQYNDEEDEAYFFTSDGETLLMSPPVVIDTFAAQIDIVAEAPSAVANDHILHIYIIKEKDVDLASNVKNVKGYKIQELKLPSAKEEIVSFCELPEEYQGVARICFEAETPDTDSMVKLYSLKMTKTEDSDTLHRLAMAGNLVYDSRMGEIYVPEEGTLEVFSMAGRRVLAVAATTKVNVTGLAPSPYIARFIDKDGKVITLKFNKK
ncbi:MAG: hypothetical protein J1F43_02835 [Muribaculaceae bacterium]|nr:hypothetical protein [Muribaculaceae bacterium]